MSAATGAAAARASAVCRVQSHARPAAPPLAWQERHGHHELADMQTTLRSAGDGFVLDGNKVLVFNGAAPDQLIGSARSTSGRFDEAGISLVRIDAAAPGVQRTPPQLMYGQWVAQVKPRQVSASQLLFAPGEAHAPLHDTVQEAALALCAEALGVMQVLQAVTLDQVKSRKQFGATIGTSQVLQHRLVDMLMVLEQMRSLLVRAVRSTGEGSAEAAQMHGGMGMTDELMVGHGMKRLMVIDSSFGNADVQRARFAALAA